MQISNNIKSINVSNRQALQQKNQSKIISANDKNTTKAAGKVTQMLNHKQEVQESLQKQRYGIYFTKNERQ